MSDSVNNWKKAGTAAQFLNKVNSKRYEGQLWQDRDLLFDSPAKYLQMRPGEEIIQILEDIEDTKGKNGEIGEFMVTNLRAIWISASNNRTNISIGYNCVCSITVKNASSRLFGQTQSLNVLTRFNNSQFEFVFSGNLGGDDQGPLFTVIQQVYRAYDTTRMYRDLKLRGSIVQDKQLKQLPLETIYNHVNGAWNLSSEQGNLGHFFITNIRLIKNIKQRRSKFGEAIVVETVSRSGGYVLGFRIDPIERLEQILDELKSIWSICSTSPFMGIQSSQFLENLQQNKESTLIDQMEQDVLVMDADDRGDVLATYYADAAKSKDREPVYSAELGLAIESLKENITIDQLWTVV